MIRIERDSLSAYVRVRYSLRNAALAPILNELDQVGRKYFLFPPWPARGLLRRFVNLLCCQLLIYELGMRLPSPTCNIHHIRCVCLWTLTSLEIEIYYFCRLITSLTMIYIFAYVYRPGRHHAGSTAELFGEQEGLHEHYMLHDE